MDAYKIAVKLFVEDDSFLMPGEFVPIFHSWIQQGAFADHVLVDVTDYRHVQDGPGTVLVAHQANLYLDKIAGRSGFTYSRKQPVEGTFADRLRQAIATALEAAEKLQSDPRVEGRLAFKTDELLVVLNDRLLAPNTPETFAAFEPELRRVLGEIYERATIKLEREPDARAPFGVHARIANGPANISELHSRLLQSS